MKEAIKLLGQYTNNRFDPYLLSGSQNTKKRVEILKLLTGKKVLVKDAGVTNLWKTLLDVLEVPDDCDAVRQRNLKAKCQELVSE